MKYLVIASLLLLASCTRTATCDDYLKAITGDDIECPKKEAM